MTIKNITEEKNVKSLIRFHSANEIDNYNGGGGNPKESTEQVKHKKNKGLSWVTAVRIFSLPGSHSPPHLPRISSNAVLISGPIGGQLRF